MNEVLKADLDFCWEKVLNSDPWFRLHYAFAPKQLGQQILALHALFSMLDRALGLSDESLRLAQLAWWRSELSPENTEVSAHPVVRTLRESGAMQQLSGDQIEALVAQAVSQLRTESLNSQEELKTLCDQVGEAKVLSEAAIACKDRAQPALVGRCAGTGLSAITREAGLEGRPALWFIPLDLQARHQSDLHTIKQSRAEIRAVLESLCRWGEAWFDEQVEALSQAVSSGIFAPGAARHLLAMVLSDQLRFLRAMKDLGDGGKGEPGPWRLADFMGIWRECRRLLKSGAGV